MMLEKTLPHRRVRPCRAKWVFGWHGAAGPHPALANFVISRAVHWRPIHALSATCDIGGSVEKIPYKGSLKSYSIGPADDQAAPEGIVPAGPLDLIGLFAYYKTEPETVSEGLGNPQPTLQHQRFQIIAIEGYRAVPKLPLQDGVVETVFQI